MSSDDFIYVPAAQRSNLDDILRRVQAEKAGEDAKAKPSPQEVLEETLRSIDINKQVSEKFTAIKAELEE